MNPDRCDDFAPDDVQTEPAKNRRLVRLLNGSWADKAISRIERYDDIKVEGVRFHGWAAWFDAPPVA